MLFLLVWGAPGALADSTVIGEQNLVPNMGSADQLGQNIPVFQGDAGAGYVLSAPQAGVITSWSFLSGGIATGKQFELAVLAPVDQSGMNWRLIATSAPVAVTTATGTDAVNGPFQVHIPIDAGERIALMPIDDSNTPIEAGTQGADGIRYFSQPFNGGLGSSQQVASADDNGQVVPIQATIAPPGGGGGGAGAPVNTALPAIRPDRRCSPSRSGCQNIPHQYVCDPGQWVGRDAAIPYTFEWEQAYGKFLIYKHEADGQTYYVQAPRVPLGDPRGIFRCLVTATGPGGSTIARSAPQKLNVAPFPRKKVTFPTTDVRVTGIEVTQAVQESTCNGCLGYLGGTLPARDQGNLKAPGKAAYEGVTLAQEKATVVRVYAHVPSGSLPGATAQLEVIDSSTRKTISVMTSSPATLMPSTCGGVCVNAAERANPGSSFNFLIPWTDTSRDFVTFRATVKPAIGPGQPLQCCHDNVFTLYNVPFKPVTTVPIHPIPLTVGGVGPNTSLPPDQVFAGAQAVYPVQLQIWPWDPSARIDGKTNYNADLLELDRAADDNLPPGAYPIGVYFNAGGPSGVGLGGFSGTTISQFDVNGLTYSGSIVPDTGRPITGVAHEIGHGLGLFHADTGSMCTGAGACPGPHPDTTPDCGGNNNGQLGESWPPDNEGQLNSIGLDIRNWSPGTAGSLPSTFVAGFDHAGNLIAAVSPGGGPLYYDLMSYCGIPGAVLVYPGGNEPLDWISMRNWERTINYPGFDRGPPAGSASDVATPAVSGPTLRVMAVAMPGGATTIQEVTADASINLPPTANSPFRIELRDAAGNVLTSVAPTASMIHVDGVGKPQGLLLAATLPMMPGTAAVTISSGGQQVASRTRSAHAPTGRLLSPLAGSRVGRTRTTLVRWSAQDADGDPLTSTVEYSPDGGQHWKVLADSVSGDSVSIPSHFLSTSRDARLRLRLSDGFNATMVESGRFRAVGAPPVVQIINPPRRRHVLSTATLLLEGSAFDDANAPLTGRHLAWYVNKRLIGRGEKVTVLGLPSGNAVIRLVATDSHGRSAHKILPLRVSPLATAYRVFRAPLKVSSKALNLRIVVASTAPATFTIAGKRYAVNRTLRTITIAFRRGRSTLRFPCTLRSPAGVIRGTFIVARTGRQESGRLSVETLFG